MRRATPYLALAAVALLGCGPKTLVLEPDLTGSYRSFARTARVSKICLIEVTGQQDFRHVEGSTTFTLDLRQSVRKAMLEGLRQTCRHTEPARGGTKGGSPAIAPGELLVILDVEPVSLHMARNRFEDSFMTIEGTVKILRTPDDIVSAAVQGRHEDGARTVMLDSLAANTIKELVDEVNEIVHRNRARLAKRSS